MKWDDVPGLIANRLLYNFLDRFGICLWDITDPGWRERYSAWLNRQMQTMWDPELVQKPKEQDHEAP